MVDKDFPIDRDDDLCFQQSSELLSFSGALSSTLPGIDFEDLSVLGDVISATVAPPGG